MNLGRAGVILPGGGLKCAFQAGALTALDELGVSFEKIQGVSGGALNAAKYAESGSRDLKPVWLEVERRGSGMIFSRFAAVRHFASGNPALYDDHGLNYLVNNLDAEKIIASPIKLEIVVWNELAERSEIIRNHEFSNDPASYQTLRRFIKASASFPGFFMPERINGQIYSDGCQICSESFADLDTVILIDCGQPKMTIDPGTLKWHERLTKRLSSMIDDAIEQDIKMQLAKFKPFPDSEEASWSVWKRISKFFKDIQIAKRLILISPSMNIPTLMLNYCEKNDISKSIQHGYERVKEIMGRLDA
ncbi:MAG: hypothetical protein UY12_C0008G0008 [Parcubacteria group bacterium GW2011_GWA2_47_8b]|uniref:PNPLA domain-containing protein n=3 Tax=Parcubacteria group TaxID=1794811 RepID=A0A0G1T3F3_9BACT|nr:MAG: hypothetical protein UY02_C0027G0005 [Candidatus Giovannonibacteria bacterium GW2011_GWB1_47_6b]KKU85178.1 MAG: hypothetical protein UY12_C0008G0008 [Parcubacteria group bacterium GW2011_GWA2_47_8b]OGY64084.1 MAG: hypothetical protein A3E64_00535 [Candidatus Harrisonbacteria bacterium RIFCSPHIGHO2_12_FULL_48_16]OGY68385.1 MAG: hypothetical protein A2214_01540 [Candidatus Harrisonbacteria bacterium RIFOXYA1_FULL_48_8]